MWFFHSGFRVLLRDDHRTVEETLDIVEKVRKLKKQYWVTRIRRSLLSRSAGFYCIFFVCVNLPAAGALNASAGIVHKSFYILRRISQKQAGFLSSAIILPLNARSVFPSQLYKG